MDYIKNVIDRALQRAKQNIKEEDKPQLRHKKGVRNRQKLYNKRLRLGRVRK